MKNDARFMLDFFILNLNDVCFLFDFQGASAELSLVAGDMIKITTDDKYKEKCTKQVLWVDYKNITKVMSVGARMFIDDGLISVIVKEMGEWCKHNVVTLYQCLVIGNHVYSRQTDVC